MAEPDGQLTLETGWFEPPETARAMRDSRYRHPANAIAELIDNAIDANARTVELLIEEEYRKVKTRSRWQVNEIAVVDNGDGMDGKTLVQALKFGGRSPSRRQQEIGKYGMGLPTASVSQCERVDVWTWQETIEQPAHSFIDMREIEAGRLVRPPEPDGEPVPGKWVARTSALDPTKGTLVVWRSIDRISAQSETIFRRIEKELGRIYRHFIADTELTIRMASFQDDEVCSDTTVRCNDPLFLMQNSATSEPWDKDPMFQEYMTRDYSLVVNGREEFVQVVYSIVKEEVIVKPDPEAPKRLPGARPYGQDARFNMGVSIVRENRELLLESAFVREGGRGAEPMNRWWGCEVRFGKGCDDLFGIDHNKQSATVISNAARELLNDDRNTDDLMDELGVTDDQVYQIVSDIRSTTSAMLRDIELFFKRRRTSRNGDKEQEPTAERDAQVASAKATEDEVESAGKPLTDTDRERAEIPEETRQEALTNYLEGRGIPDAEDLAKDAAENNFPCLFVAERLDGHQMFSVRHERGTGTLVINLNIHHPLYEFLEFLEEDNQKRGHDAAVAIRVLLFAWARMEELTDAPGQRAEMQDFAMRWGRQAREALAQLDIDAVSGEAEDES